MRLPRGVSADRVIDVMKRLGHGVVRRQGSHVRLRHDGPPVHTITVPVQDSLKTGTLHGIPSEIARMRSIAVESIAALL